jgi:uncharacterized damage-inducible protein DinB
MKEMTAESAMHTLHNLYLPTLKNESRTTTNVLVAVPADRSDYRPDPYGKTAMELVRHIANADNVFVEGVINGRFEPGTRIPESAKTPQEIASWYEGHYAKNFEALTKATPEQLTKIIDFRGLFQWPGLNFLMFGLHHTIHHRGQLSSYLRSMGSKVPAIYGESYDSEQAKKATAQA